MDDYVEDSVPEFDAWYSSLISVLASRGLRAPYKLAWLEFYNRGMSPEEAADLGPTVES